MEPDKYPVDTELVSLLMEGDEEIFRVIYQKYASPLFGFARKNIVNREDCEEIVQEVFESLWNRREELGHVTSLQAYLYQMVRYKIIRYFQHQKVKQKYADHYRIFETAYELTPEFDRNSAVIQEKIVKCLEALPDRCQQALKLRLTENLNNSEIARRMKIQTTTVENYMVRALRHLRDHRENILDSINN